MELKFILESLLFSAQKPLSPSELRDIFATAAAADDADTTVKGLKKTKEADIIAALEELAKEHEAVLYLLHLHLLIVPLLARNVFPSILDSWN